MNVRWEASNLTTHGGSVVSGMLGGLALIGLVLAAVSFYVGAGAPDGAEILGWIGLAVGVVMAPLAIYFARKNGARVRAGWDGDAVRLEITSRAGVVSHRGPFQIERGWMRDAVATGRGSISTTLVMLVVRDEKGRALLYLTEQLGAIYAPPPSFPERSLQVAECPHVYTNTVGRLHLDRLADALSPRS